MTDQHSHLPLIAIVGPTASGKSTLGVWLAERLGGEIVACDSTQLYRGFDIGTAKPGQSERRGIAHHLIDVLDPTEKATAGGYREMAVAALAGLRRRARIPILTVGTGLYLRALLDGLADLPLHSEELRQRLRATSQRHDEKYLHRILRRLDPEAAGKIAPTDEQKIIRAIEVCILARRPISEVHRAGRRPLTGWRPCKIGLNPPRELLYKRINSRTDSMLERGWLAEVQRLLGSGFSEDAKPFDFLGYRELRSVLRGEGALEEARVAIQQATRRYAKRQLTWFRKDTAIRWFSGVGDAPPLQDEVLKWLQSEMMSTSREVRKSGV